MVEKQSITKFPTCVQATIDPVQITSCLPMPLQRLSRIGPNCAAGWLFPGTASFNFNDLLVAINLTLLDAFIWRGLCRSSNNCPSTSKGQSVRPEAKNNPNNPNNPGPSQQQVNGRGQQMSLSEKIMQGAMNARCNSPPSSSTSSEGNDDAAMAVIMSLLEVTDNLLQTLSKIAKIYSNSEPKSQT